MCYERSKKLAAQQRTKSQDLLSSWRRGSKRRSMPERSYPNRPQFTHDQDVMNSLHAIILKGSKAWMIGPDESVQKQMQVSIRDQERILTYSIDVLSMARFLEILWAIYNFRYRLARYHWYRRSWLACCNCWINLRKLTGCCMLWQR